MAAFDPQRHPRGGNPNNPGEFSPRRGTPPEGGTLPTRQYHAVAPEELRLTPLCERDLAVFSVGSIPRALARFRARLAFQVHGDAALEDSTFTLPQVEELLVGTIPDGKSHKEVFQVLGLARGSAQLGELVASGAFRLNWDTADLIHRDVAAAEVIEPGVRRHRSTMLNYTGPAAVNVEGDLFLGYPLDDADHAEEVLLRRVRALHHPAQRALNFAAIGAYGQFYSDGNKRTARYLMNGELLAHGIDAIEVPQRRKRDYEGALAQMYRTGDTGPYVEFLMSVAREGQ